MSPEYKALCNFLKNTCELNKENVKQLIEEVVAKTVEKEVRDYLRSQAFLNQITKALSQYKYATFGDAIKRDIATAVEKVVREKLDEVGFTIALNAKEKNGT